MNEWGNFSWEVEFKFPEQWKNYKMVPIRNRAAVFLTGNVLKTINWSVMSAAFLAVLKEPFDRYARFSHFVPARPSVALHVRRGDLPPGDPRLYPDTLFFKVVEVIRSLLPNVDVHVFSSTVKDHIPRVKGTGLNFRWDQERGVGEWEHIVVWNSSTFDGYRQRAMQVHLDDSDLMMPWSHLAQATVLVASDSAFSDIPIMLNPNCVIGPNAILVGPQRFAQILALEDKMKLDLQTCLARIGWLQRAKRNT